MVLKLLGFYGLDTAWLGFRTRPVLKLAGQCLAKKTRIQHRAPMLEEFSARKFKIALPVNKLAHDTKPVEKGRKSPKKIDMLDSWARLTGSYGSGKR